MKLEELQEVVGGFWSVNKLEAEEWEKLYDLYQAWCRTDDFTPEDAAARAAIEAYGAELDAKYGATPGRDIVQEIWEYLSFRT